MEEYAHSMICCGACEAPALTLRPRLGRSPGSASTNRGQPRRREAPPAPASACLHACMQSSVRLPAPRGRDPCMPGRPGQQGCTCRPAPCPASASVSVSASACSRQPRWLALSLSNLDCSQLYGKLLHLIFSPLLPLHTCAPSSPIRHCTALCTRPPLV